eukprot:gene21586-25625_t
MAVFIFVTNINTKRDINRLKPYLDHNQDIINWTVTTLIRVCGYDCHKMDCLTFFKRSGLYLLNRKLKFVRTHKTTMQINFEPLYFLDSPDLSIFEIKRLDQPLNSPLEDVFFWMIYHKERKEIQRLTFRSMDSSSVLEERFFIEGFLKFSNTEGTYIAKYNSGQYDLKHLKAAEFPQEISDAIQFFGEVQTGNPYSVIGHSIIYIKTFWLSQIIPTVYACRKNHIGYHTHFFFRQIGF